MEHRKADGQQKLGTEQMTRFEYLRCRGAHPDWDRDVAAEAIGLMLLLLPYGELGSPSTADSFLFFRTRHVVN